MRKSRHEHCHHQLIAGMGIHTKHAKDWDCVLPIERKRIHRYFFNLCSPYITSWLFSSWLALSSRVLSCLCKVISTVSNGTNNSRSCNLSGQYRGRFCALSHKKLDCTVSAAEPRHVVAETQNLYPLLSTRTSFVNCFQLC